ncbi:MAG: terminase small subunit [Rhodocyclaceae bacterium]|nr:terminase small subunit [Rhodocyclaceae bacterium]
MLLQETIAEHLDMDQSSVSRLCAELEIDWRNSTIDQLRIAYIRRLREQAAGRAASGDLDLAGERARLAKEQADRVSMQNAVTRGELAPVILIEEVLTKAASKVAGIFDAIPGVIRRRLPALPEEALRLIADEIAKARNTVAKMSLADLSDADLPDDAAVLPAPTFEGDAADAADVSNC